MTRTPQPTLFDAYDPPGNEVVLRRVHRLLDLYRSGSLGGEKMPEDAAPQIREEGQRALFFTLPMALNYQRNSYALWEAAAKAYGDARSRWIFDPLAVSARPVDELREVLVLHRVALQPARHPDIWSRICNRLADDYDGSILALFRKESFRVDQIARTVRIDKKASFPYLSGPKIFNYWLYVMEQYCAITFVDRDNISVAPDTHVMQSSVRLGLQGLGGKTGPLLQDAVATAWVELLADTDLAPIDVHSALWLWSRAGFPSVE